MIKERLNSVRVSQLRLQPVALLLMFVILLLAGGFTAAQLSDSYRLREAIDARTVVNWSDLLSDYLSLREDAWPLVVPTSVLLADNIEKALDAIDWKVGDDPHWYWTFDMGAYYYDAKDPLAASVQEGLQVIVYEDVLSDEVLLLADFGKGYEEVIVYRSPPWPEGGTDDKFEDILYVELSRRRIVGAFTLHSREWALLYHDASPVSFETLALNNKSTGGARGSGTNEFAITDFLRGTNGLVVEFDGATSCYYKVESVSDLYEQDWGTTNMLLGVSGTMGWTHVGSTNEPTLLLYRIRELSRSDPGDEDADRMDDVWELIYSLNPLDASDALSDGDADGLTSYQEYQGDTPPNVYDSNTNGVPDGWDIYSGDLPHGDVNGDGTVSSADLTAFDNLLLSSAYDVNPVTFAQADLNLDGALDQVDRGGLVDLLDGKPILFVLQPVIK